MLRIARLLGRLPLPVLHALGAVLGWLVYAASPTYRRHLAENLALALPQADGRLRRAAAAEAGKGMLELFHIWLQPRDRVVGLVTRVTGWELVEEAWQRGTGIIFLTPHLGCFDITARYYAAHAPVTVLYRPPKQRWLQPLIEQGRGGDNLHLAAADLTGVRTLMRALKRHEAIGILPDQVPGFGEGAWATFFGRPAYTMTLAARLTENSGATLIMCYAERLPGGKGYHFRLSAPASPPSGGLEARTQAINRALEELILRCPAQYLWGYNRYKVPAGARRKMESEA